MLLPSTGLLSRAPAERSVSRGKCLERVRVRVLRVAERDQYQVAPFGVQPAPQGTHLGGHCSPAGHSAVATVRRRPAPLSLLPGFGCDVVGFGGQRRVGEPLADHAPHARGHHVLGVEGSPVVASAELCDVAV